MADPRIEQWREYVGEDPQGSLYPPDDVSLDLRRRRAQNLREQGIHVPVPEAEVDVDKYRSGPRYHTTSRGADLFFHGDPETEGTRGIVDTGRNLPEFPVKLGALPGMTQREINEASGNVAKTIQTGLDYGTLPFYFTGLAPLVGAIDISRGLIEKSPLEMAIGMWGVSKPLRHLARTIPQKTEDLFLAGGSLAALPYAINDAYDFLSSLGAKAAQEDQPPVGGL